MAYITGIKQLAAKLKARLENFKPVVRVGYTQSYAVHVHENMETHHPVGQAKFLEQPARALSNDGTFAEIIKKALKSGKTLAKALLLCGLRLQRESQQLVPVDTGALKASAFTRLEE